MELTVTFSGELADKLRPLQAQIPELLERALRERESPGLQEYSGLAAVLDTLAALPSAEEVLALRPSPQLQERIEQLLAKSKEAGFTPDEQREWDAFEYVQHLVRMAKARAVIRLKQAS